jgi:hypothetical protein
MAGSRNAAPGPRTESGVADALAVEAQVSDTLDWFAHPAARDVRVELADARTRLSAFSALPVSINQFHRILDLFQGRADTLATAAKVLLRDAGQPLAPDLHLLAQHLDHLESQICDGYLRVIKDIEHRFVRSRRRDPSTVAARALKALRERLEIAAYASKAVPPELWAQAHHLYRVSRTNRPPANLPPDAGPDAGRVYREMLAFAAVQSERLSGLEVAGAADYLGRFAPAVMLFDIPPTTADFRMFWVDPELDSAPVALARKLPPAGDEVLYFSCARLGTLAAEHLRELEAGTAPAQLRLPPEAAKPAYRGLLHKLHETWAEPPARHLVRRHHSYPVRMCIGLPALGRLFDPLRREDDESVFQSDWTVLNESPSGFALVHAAGDIGGVQTGAAVAIRAASDKPWDLCIVRWMRNEPTDTVEIGLQILASSAQTVRLAFRHTPAPQPTVTALRLPALRALRAHDAILAPSGTATSQRFVMVAEDERTHVTQGRVVNLDLQTACVELFQFQDDPYPL